MRSLSERESSTDLQQRFSLAEEVPLRTPYADGEILNYYFTFDEVRLGEVEIIHRPHQNHFTWNRFYPFCPHLTQSELFEQWSYLVPKNATQQTIDRLRYECCSTRAQFPGLEGKGLGTWGHVLVVRDLCQRILDPSLYTASYCGDENVEPRLRNTLERAGIADMVDHPVPLQEIHDKLLQCARTVFGFTLDSSHLCRHPIANTVD